MFYLETRSVGFPFILNVMTPGFAFFPNYPALLCPVVSVGVMVAWDVRLSPRVCQWPVVCAWSTGSHTVRKLIGET